MKDTLKCVESRQLHKEDCLQEIRVELRGNVGVPSISSTSEEGRNDVSEYASKLLERILETSNMNFAYKRVKANKGSHGVDGMTVDELLPFLKQNGKQLIQTLLEGNYKPQPVRRVEIPKPDGGIRLLGIPTVIDRVIQQSIAQVLSPIYELKFSETSYGFRPNKSAKEAVLKCKEYIDAGYRWAVDIDLRSFISISTTKCKCCRLIILSIVALACSVLRLGLKPKL